MKIITLFIFVSISLFSCERNTINNDVEKLDKISKKENGTKTKDQSENEGEFKAGDLIFQITENGQSHAIQFLTNSKYSHVGIILKTKKGLFVYEASNKVRFTPLDKFIKSGVDGHFSIKRLKNANQILTEEALLNMKKIGEKFYRKTYDLCFEWSDDKIYCSELVWKIYNEALNIEIGTPKTLSDYDLSYGPAQKIIKKRMARNGCSFSDNEIVISPADIFHSELLKTIDIDQ